MGSMADEFLSYIPGLIHVGANTGQERGVYAAHDLHVLWIEALPNVHAVLAANLARFPRQRAVQALVTDRPGQNYTFHVSSNGGESSSIYDLALHRDIWPQVSFSHDVELVSSTLDQVVMDTNTNLSLVGALVMDTQGSELLVLKGAGKVVRTVRYIKTEAADFESYVGCTTVAELTAYLSGQGFELASKEPFAQHPAGGQYFNLLFKRRQRTWASFVDSLGPTGAVPPPSIKPFDPGKP
jgi:FkbM family methyltransferase